jgi:hypothetical protein
MLDVVKDFRAGQPRPASGSSTDHKIPSGGSTDRAASRRRYLDTLLQPWSLGLGDIAPPTRRALEGYARFMLLVAPARSASWNTAVVELCRAAESEVVVTLHDCLGLTSLGRLALGEKASLLRSLSPAAVAWLSSRRYMAYASTTLPKRLLALAQIRRDSGAAHGGPEEREARRADHDPALRIALTGPEAVIPSLARLRRDLRGVR